MVGRGFGNGMRVLASCHPAVIHKIWDTPEEAVAIHSRWCEQMRSLGLPEKIIDPETEALWEDSYGKLPMVPGSIISDFVKNGSLSHEQYSLEAVTWRSNTAVKDFPEGKGLCICAACSATLEDF